MGVHVVSRGEGDEFSCRGVGAGDVAGGKADVGVVGEDRGVNCRVSVGFAEASFPRVCDPFECSFGLASCEVRECKKTGARLRST